MKRILAMALSVMLVATLAISGTVAYFTDDESAVNTMTVGSVNIKLWEHQREIDPADGDPKEDGNLVLFEDDKNLMPLVRDDDDDDTDDWGLSTEANYVDKIVRVENTGESDAYVRVFVAVPSALEDVNGKGRALHWDFGTDFINLDIDPAVRPTYDFTGPVPVLYGQDIDGIPYNIYCFTHNSIVPAADTLADMTSAAIVGFYLDPAVDYDDATNTYYLGSKSDANNIINYDLGKDIKIPVFAQAIQAEGFGGADDAFAGPDNVIGTADDSMPWNPWNAGTMLPESGVEATYKADASNAQSVISNLANGESVLLAPGNYGDLDLNKRSEGIVIMGSQGTVVGSINLNESKNVTIQNVTFDAAKAEVVYNKKSGATNYVASITGSQEGGNEGANGVVIKNCVFTGTYSGSASYAPICFEEQGRPTSRATNITVENCKFLCDAINYIRMNYLSEGSAVIKNNTFGGEGYATSHNTMNFTGNAADLTITDNKIFNWRPEKNSIGTSRQNTNIIDIVITGNTFSNTSLPLTIGDDVGGIVDLKTSYTTSNCTVNISGNTYIGALSTLTDTTAPMVLPK